MYKMLEIAEQDVVKRLRFDNPWWQDGLGIDKYFHDMPRRSYFGKFVDLVMDRSLRRAAVLMGPRRVGKTVMVYQAIEALLDSGVARGNILYLSLETPLYTGYTLEKLLGLFKSIFGHDKEAGLYVFFDEVQYLKNWEVHLKSLVDSYSACKFVVTGSAAAALRMKSIESGAGRFTDFILPPLTFAEYLRFIGKVDLLIATRPALPGERQGVHQGVRQEVRQYEAFDIKALNDEFVNYLNFGGYPEAVFSEAIRHNTQQYIKSDIVDKVLLRDLPSLYGINDIQELNRLFTTLAYNTGNEVSLEGLCQSSGVAKNTIKRYLEYLEAAFLIQRVERIDQNARRFKRAVCFKVYLTNPSMRAALFGQIDADAPEMGQLTETAIFSQWQHSESVTLFYARWNTGEVDIVSLDPRTQRPAWAVEVKWTDKPVQDHAALANCVELARQNPGLQMPILITTRTVSGLISYKDVNFQFQPSSLYAYLLGANILQRKLAAPAPAPEIPAP